MGEQDLVAWFGDLRMQDVERVGGKNASLGEMKRGTCRDRHHHG